MARFVASPQAGWWAALAGLCAVLLAPLLVVDVPPLLDYPNHLARLFVLAHLPGDAVLAGFYAPNWSLVPDLGIDLIGPPLIRLLPAHVAGRIILGVALLLPVLGAVAFSHAWSGRRSWWALGAVLVAYNETFLLGFINFTASMGLAMLLAAHWLRWRDARPGRTLLVTALGLLGLFFCHLMGVVFFATLIGAHELAWAWPRLRGGNLRAVFVRLGAAGALFLPLLALYARSPLAHEAGGIVYPALSTKFAQLLAPWVNYLWLLDLFTAVCLVAMAVTQYRRPSLRTGILITSVMVAYLAAPAEASGVANIDLRFVIFGGFLVFAIPAPARLPRWIAVALLALFIGRMGVLATLWQGHAAELAAFRKTIAPIPPGATVLVTNPPPAAGISARLLSSGQVTDTHLPALVLIERRAWWPFLFDNESQQPVATREPYRSLALRIDALGWAGAGLPGAEADLKGIDFVLLRGGPLAVPPHWQEVAVSPGSRLYRVRPD